MNYPRSGKRYDIIDRLFERPSWEPDPDLFSHARQREPRLFNSMAVSDQTRSPLERTQVPSTLSPQFPAGAFDVPQYESSFPTPQDNAEDSSRADMRRALGGMLAGASGANSAMNSYADAMRMPRPEAVARGAGTVVGGALNALGQVVGMHGKLTPKRSQSYSKVPLSPQAIDENGEVYGWFALGPKVGPYAMSKTGLTTRFAVYDVHAARDVNLHRMDPFKITKAGNEKLWEGPRDRADRYAYQRGNDIASDVLGVDVGRIQAARWYGKKSMDEFFGVRTPGGTSTSAYDEATQLANMPQNPKRPNGPTRGHPYPDRNMNIMTWRRLAEYVQKNKLTPEEADAAAQDLKFLNYDEFAAALQDAEARSIPGKKPKKPVPPNREDTR